MRKKFFLMITLLICCVLAGQAATPLKVAYVTSSATPPATDEVYVTLTRHFDVTVTTALDGTGDACANADVIFLSEYPGSSGVNTAYLKNCPKPMFFMKGHGAQNNRWGWSAVSAVQSKDDVLSIDIPDASHDLYKGLRAESGSSYKMLTAVDQNGFIAVPQLKAKAAVQAASYIGVTGDSLVIGIFPAGTQADGTNALTSSYVYFGLTTTSFPYMTANAKQLIVNGVKFLGGEAPTGKEEMPAKVLYVTNSGSLALAVDPLYNALVASGYDNIKVQEVTSSSATPDTAGQDMVFISEIPGSGNLNSFKNLAKPVFFMKGHQLNNAGRWNWNAGAIVQTPMQTQMYVPSAMRTDNPLFANVVFVGDSTQLLMQVGNSKGFLGLGQFKAGSSATVVGTVLNAAPTDTVMVYYPAGTAADGTNALLSDYCYLGITGADSYKYMTKNAIQIALNVIAKLTNTTAKVVADAAFTVEEAAGGSITGKNASYYAGEYFSVNAVPNDGCTFVKWEKKVGSVYEEYATTATISGCLPASLTLRPVFESTASEPVYNRTNIKVAYLTKAAATADSLFAVLNRNFFTDNIIGSGTLAQADLDTLGTYDVVVVPANYDGGNLNLLRNFRKPVLVMHSGILVEDNTFYEANTGARWNWVVARAGHSESVGYEYNMVFQNSIAVDVADKSHGLYKGLKFIGNTLALLDTVKTNAGVFHGLATTGQPKTGSLKAKVVPEFPSTPNNYALYYQAKGNVADGTNALASNYCFIGLHWEARNFINANFKQLLVNAVNVLADSVPAGDEELAGVVAPAVSGIGNIPATLNLRVPAVHRLSGKVNGTALTGKVVRYESSNPAVATVDIWGNVQAVSAGTANIIAKVADGTGSASFTCAVTVTGTADVIVSESFTDWQKRTKKLNLARLDSTPNFPRGSFFILNEVAVERPLRGAATGNVEFMLKNVGIVPFVGSKFLNEYPGVAVVSGTQNNNASGNVSTSPASTAEGYDPSQGDEGVMVGAESNLTIGQVDKEVKTIELLLAMENNRVAYISKSYDGVNWVNVDAVKGGSEGRLGYFIMPNQMANKFIIDLPKAEKNFFLKIGPGRNSLNSVRTDGICIHSVKYYGPNGLTIPVTGVMLSVVEKPTSATVSNDTIYMTAPATWCESAGIVKLDYICAPADATNTNVVWSSGNTAVVEVNATGNLIPKGAGKATITATAEGTAVKATYTVVVTQTASGGVICPDDVTITKTWSGQYLQLNANDNIELEAVVSPANATHKSVVFTVDKPDFAEVTVDGVLTGVNKGWITVYATVQTPNEEGQRIVDSIDVRILSPRYLGGDPMPDSGAPALPMLFNAREKLSPTVKNAANQLDEAWAKSVWFDFATTGLRKELNSDATLEDLNFTRIQGVYLNGVTENEAVADFANIGLKTTKAAGRQTRLIFAFDGVLDSVQLGVVVTNTTNPSAVAIQESNDGEQWNDVFYFVNDAASAKENEPSSTWFEMTKEYRYPVVKGFNSTSRFIRLFQTESGSTSASSANIYLDRVYLYGSDNGGEEPCDTCGSETGIVSSYVADHGFSVYPNPTDGAVYFSGEKAVTRVEVVNLHSGMIVKRIPQDGVTEAKFLLDDLAGGVYLVVIFVEGDNKPQVVKINKR